MFKRANTLFKRKSQTSDRESVKSWSVEGIPVPIHLFVEARRNSRVSLLKDKVHVRLPNRMSKQARQLEINKLLKWARTRIAQKNLYAASQQVSRYSEGRQLELMGEEWVIQITSHLQKKEVIIDTTNRIIVIKRLSNANKDKKTILDSKIAAKAVIEFKKKEVSNLLSTINDKTFGFKYGDVKLKHLKSRWGSCSAKRNINLSVRLLLLPKEVREYVMIHELAHLKEMNHSDAFWSLVSQHCPDYKKHDRWLKVNGHRYDF